MNTKLKLICFVLLLNLQTSLYSVEKLTASSPVSISVIIPCISKHQDYLPMLLEEYSHQTVLPNEIIISLNPKKAISKSIRRRLEKTNWPFTVKVIYDRNMLTASSNRNKATAAATSDIISYQDADDLPHIQRIEVIKHFFENYNIDHLMHGYFITNQRENKLIGHESSHYMLELKPIESIENLQWSIPEFHYPNLGANNSISIRRHVFEKVKWEPEMVWGEDSFFNNTVYSQFENRILVEYPLLNYFIR